tara:strand:+ start:1040 stop:2959 length:1920 start_codon:yes stop_codon:yes gene_type:complete
MFSIFSHNKVWPLIFLSVLFVTKVQGSQSSYQAAFLLLKQSTFGPTAEEVERVQTAGISAWVNQQLEEPSAYSSDSDTHLTHLERLIEVATSLEPVANWFKTPNDDVGSKYFDGRGTGRTADYQMSVWFENALNGEDQLRQRVAYALSQIMVVSARQLPLDRQAESLAHYYDILARNAFGSFRSLLGEVARSPAMGIYLSHQGNEKANPSKNTLPDENFARELMQLFTIGLYKLGPNGVAITNAEGVPVPSYTQQDIEELARVMTGWDLQYNSKYGRQDGSFVDYMEFNTDQHDFGEKTLLGQQIPANLTNGSDLDAALDILFAHENVAPFISKLLIQRLVSSNPSPSYVGRVASAFNDNGNGQRGDLKAVIRAVLLDPEARDPQAQTEYFGKVNEPLLAYTAFYRAFDAQPINGWMIDSDAGLVPSNNTYYFRIHELLGQGPLRAPHVFNFYDNDYVPPDSSYQNASPQKVLPEMQLRTPRNIALQFEALRVAKHVLERNDLLRRNASIADYVAERNQVPNSWNWARAVALLDFSPALNAFEMAVDGDSNGDFLAIDDTNPDGDGRTPKVRGIHALLDFLQHRLLGDHPLSEADRETLAAYLDQDSYFNPGNNVDEAYRLTVAAIQYVIMSSVNFTQR